MNAKDVRIKKTTEILVGIKYIKMCGTEEKFLESVSSLIFFWNIRVIFILKHAKTMVFFFQFFSIIYSYKPLKTTITQNFFACSVFL